MRILSSVFRALVRGVFAGFGLCMELTGVGERQATAPAASSVNILVLRHILQQFLAMNNDPAGEPEVAQRSPNGRRKKIEKTLHSY